MTQRNAVYLLVLFAFFASGLCQEQQVSTQFGMEAYIPRINYEYVSSQPPCPEDFRIIPSIEVANRCDGTLLVNNILVSCQGDCTEFAIPRFQRNAVCVGQVENQALTSTLTISCDSGCADARYVANQVLDTAHACTPIF
ncbi:hypothetical protein QOT17_022341 [Balamuthia mandrillaris]